MAVRQIFSADPGHPSGRNPRSPSAVPPFASPVACRRLEGTDERRASIIVLHYTGQDLPLSRKQKEQDTPRFFTYFWAVPHSFQALPGEGPASPGQSPGSLHLFSAVMVGLSHHTAQQAVYPPNPVKGQELGLVGVHQAILPQDGRSCSPAGPQSARRRGRRSSPPPGTPRSGGTPQTGARPRKHSAPG